MAVASGVPVPLGPAARRAQHTRGDSDLTVLLARLTPALCWPASPLPRPTHPPGSCGPNAPPALPRDSLKVRILLELSDRAEGHHLLPQADHTGRVGGVGKHPPCGHRHVLQRHAQAAAKGKVRLAHCPPTIAVDSPELLGHPENGLHPELGPVVPVEGGWSPTLEIVGEAKVQPPGVPKLGPTVTSGEPSRQLLIPHPLCLEHSWPLFPPQIWHKSRGWAVG